MGQSPPNAELVAIHAKVSPEVMPEIVAMASICEALEGLAPEAQRRVVSWAMSCWGEAKA